MFVQSSRAVSDKEGLRAVESLGVRVRQARRMLGARCVRGRCRIRHCRFESTRCRQSQQRPPEQGQWGPRRERLRRSGSFTDRRCRGVPGERLEDVGSCRDEDSRRFSIVARVKRRTMS